MKINLLFAFCFFSVFLSTVSAFAQFNFDADDNAAQDGPALGKPQTQIWRAGLTIAAGTAMQNAEARIPVPMEWFGQKIVKVSEEKIDPALSGKINYRVVNGGATEMILKLGGMRPNRPVEIVVAVEVQSYDLQPPTKTEHYLIPKRTPTGLAPYLQKSPNIESDKSVFKQMFTEITKDKKTAWDKVEAVYTYVQNNVSYDEAGKKNPAKGALAVTKMPKGEWKGDCKDMCCLFIALCRAGKVPARLVRVPEHCYAEFYLEVPEKAAKDKKGKNNGPQGFWFPCQVAGTYSFGGIQERYVILQKGDSYPDRDGGLTLFLKECFEGNLVPGSQPPKLKWIHELKDAD